MGPTQVLNPGRKKWEITKKWIVLGMKELCVGREHPLAPSSKERDYLANNARRECVWKKITFFPTGQREKLNENI